MNRPPLLMRLTKPIRCDGGDTLTAPGFATRRSHPVTPSLVLHPRRRGPVPCPPTNRRQALPNQGASARPRPTKESRLPAAKHEQRSGMGAVQCDRLHSRFTTRSQREGRASSRPQNEGLAHGTRPQQSPFQGGILVPLPRGWREAPGDVSPPSKGVGAKRRGILVPLPRGWREAPGDLSPPSKGVARSAGGC